jgi:HAD superfamily hydrolase (TIGR01509 family)
MEKEKAIIFDMDGVIIESEPLYRIAAEKVVNNHGGIYTDEIGKKEMGLGIIDASKVIIEETGINNISPESFSKEYMEEYLKISDKMLKKNEGVNELISYAKKEYKIAVASSTNVEIVEKLLKKINLFNEFDFVIGGNMVTKAKPDPEIYSTASRNINITPDKCTAIEDSLNGAISALKAGMSVLIVKHSLSNHLTFPDTCIIFENLFEIKNYLSKINNQE